MIVILGLVVFSTFISCDDSDDDSVVLMPKNIVELASASTDLSSLVAAIQKAGLVETLSADGTLTVFAPTNAAFQSLLDSNSDWNSLEDIPMDLLTNVLKFHVLDQKVTSDDLSDSYVKTLAVGPNEESLSLQIETTEAIEFNGDSKPITANLEAKNGIVHIIDKVMLPPNVVTTAINNSNFSMLVAALTDSRHATDFASILNGDGPFTIFAPTNDAFQVLLDSNSAWSSLTDIPIETLDTVLKYHVVNAANVQSKQLQDNQEIKMFSSDKITVDLTNGTKLKTSSGQIVTISATDIQGINGVIHVVDAVLLP
ncbi:fasciclin domain-containing protein [Tenacibaculum sp. C7A-26P2]|uniref:fasciclin domain-containing protein n=1 Tax=Tenacibaculum sp. C7A-26P2 TaxID=3447504 RepID=UPI003F867407